MTHSWNASAVSCDKTITISIIIAAYSIFSLQLCNSVIQTILESLSRYKSSPNHQKQKNSVTWSSCVVVPFSGFSWHKQLQLLHRPLSTPYSRMWWECSGMGSLIQTTLSWPGSVLPEDNKPPLVSLSIAARVFPLIPEADFPWDDKVCGSAC